MMYSQRQPLKTRQNNMTLLMLKIDGTLATPIAAGLDAKFISSVVDLGAGNYQVILKDSARRFVDIVGHEVFTDGLYLLVTAVAKNGFTVLIKTFAGVATDGSFGITLAYHDDPTLY